MTEQATKRYVMVFGVISILSFLTVFLSDYTGCANAATCGIGDTRVLSAGLTGNEDGGDSDSRIESLNDQYAWMVNAGADAVLIGQETPDAGEKFTVNGTSKFKGASSFTTITATGGTITGITDLAVADGGTGSSTASGARTNLGVAIGSDVQAWDADLDTVSGLAKTDGNIIVGDGLNWTVESGATARTSLGLAIGADVQAYHAALASISSLTTAVDKMIYTTLANTYAVTDLTSAARNLLDDANAATMRTTLGVDAAGTDNSTDVTLAGVPDYITIAGQVITRGLIDLTTDVTGDLPIAEGGTGSSTASGARTNLGLGSLATQSNVDNGDWSGTDLSVANGGTGASTLTDHYVLVGSGTGAITPVSPGTAGWVLTSNGTGLDPTFQAGAAGGNVAFSGTYSGNGSTTQAITGVGCKPMYLKIIKSVTVDTNSQQPAESWDTIIDNHVDGMAIRLGTHLNTDIIRSFDSDGFTVGDAGININALSTNFDYWGMCE